VRGTEDLGNGLKAIFQIESGVNIDNGQTQTGQGGQGNASTGLGIAPDQRHVTTFDVLSGDKSLLEAAHRTAVPNLYIVPANADLVGFESEHMGDRNRAFRLRDAVTALIAYQHNQHAQRGEPPFSYILLDCPPSLNLLTINAMTAAHSILVPLQCEFFALEGLSQLLHTVEQVKQSLNPELTIHGIVLTMFDSRNNLSAQVVADVRAHMGDAVYDTIIPRNVRVSEAPSYGKPVLLYDFKSAGSQAYLRLAAEIIQRERRLRAA